MSRTAVQLIQELANRMGELAVITSTASGTTTQITSTDLDQYIPQATANMASWVHCLGGTNVGVERRAKSYTPSSDLLTLHAPGFPNLTESGVQYEMHARTRRVRKLEALNSAIRQLGLYWPRDVVDASLTGIAAQYEYTLPASINWANVWDVQLQHTSDPPTYPYDDARSLRWDVRRSMSAAGVETWTLVFGGQPTVGRTIRVKGSAFFSDLVADADVLPMGGMWEGKMIEWIMDWAKYKLLDETVERQPGGEAERYRQRAVDKLQQAKEELILSLKPKGGNKITTPFSSSAGNRRGINLAEFNIFGLAGEFS